MSLKAQHRRAYQPLPGLMRALREEAGLTQRALGKRLNVPQSFVHNCEIANRRVDFAEFVLWCQACEVEPVQALRRYMRVARLDKRGR